MPAAVAMKLPPNQYGAGGRLLPDAGPPPQPTGQGGAAPTNGLTTRGSTRQALVLLPVPIAGQLQWQLVAPFNPQRNYLILQNQTGGAVIQVSFNYPISPTQDLGILIPAGGNYELNVFVPVDNVYVSTLSTAVVTSNVTVLEG